MDRRFLKLRAPLLLVLLAIPLMGCSEGMSKGVISAGAVSGPLTLVADRHDRYVAVDPLLSDVERETALRTTRMLRMIVAEAQK